MPNPYLTETGARRVNPFLEPQPQKELSWLEKLSKAKDVASYRNRGRRGEVRQEYEDRANMPNIRRQQQANFFNAQQTAASDEWERQDVLRLKSEEKEGSQESWVSMVKQYAANNPGKKFPVTNQQWGRMSQTTRDKIMTGMTTGPTAAQAKMTKGAADTQSAYQNVVDKGFFTGTIQDFGALTDSDRSDFIKLASTPKEYMNRKMIEAEYNAEKYTVESWKESLRTGDPMALVPKISEWRGIPKEQMEAEISRSKEYNKEMAPIRAVQENHAKMMASLNAGNGAGDMAAIFTFMKTLDPPSTVREGEFALAAQVGGLRDQWMNAFQKFSEGDILTQEKARPQLAELSTKILMLTKQSRDGIRTDYINRNKRYGLDDDSVLGSRIFDYENLPQYTPKGRDPAIEALLTKPKVGG